jgi:hypothetical protein
MPSSHANANFAALKNAKLNKHYRVRLNEDRLAHSPTTSASTLRPCQPPRTIAWCVEDGPGPSRAPERQQTAFRTPSYRRIVIRTSLAASLVGSLALRPFASTSQGASLAVRNGVSGALCI